MSGCGGSSEESRLKRSRSGQNIYILQRGTGISPLETIYEKRARCFQGVAILEIRMKLQEEYPT